MKGVTVRGSIRNPKELASLVGRCNVFLYLSLPFCRQLINNKQLGDIEVAIRSIKRNIDDAKESVRTGKPLDKVDTSKMTSEELKAYELGLAERTNKYLDSTPADKVVKKKKRKLTRVQKDKIRSKAGLMGGGKVYTSMDKKYGGGIFPRKGKM